MHFFSSRLAFEASYTEQELDDSEIDQDIHDLEALMAKYDFPNELFGMDLGIANGLQTSLAWACKQKQLIFVAGLQDDENKMSFLVRDMPEENKRAVFEHLPQFLRAFLHVARQLEEE